MNQKRMLALFLALLMTLSLAGCLVKEEPETGDATAAPADPAEQGSSDPTDAPAFDPEAVAIELGDIRITAEQVQTIFDSYIGMFSYSGSIDQAAIDQCREMTVQYLIEEYMPQWKAAEMGITLTAEEEEAIDAEGLSRVNEERDQLICQFAYYSGAVEEAPEDVSSLTDEQRDAALQLITEQLAQVFYEGYTFEQYLAFEQENINTGLRLDKLKEKLREESEKDFAISDEQVEEWYEKTLASQQESFDGNASNYLTHVNDYASDNIQYPPLYVPEGVLRVRIIEIAPEQERDLKIDTNRADMAELEQEYGKLLLNGENAERQAEIQTAYAALKEENDALEEAFSGEANQRINKAYELLREETPFEDVMKEYNAEGSTAETLILAENDPVYDELGTYAAELLPGTFSESLRINDVFYIVQLIEKVPSGAVDRTAIADAIKNAAETDAKDDAWSALEEAWVTEAEQAAVYHEETYAMLGADYLS